MADCWECENVNTQMCEGCKDGGGRMTRGEAIEILKDLWTYLQTDIRQALEMAIKALEEPSGDLISRQAVEEMIKAEMPERGMWEIEGDKEKETVCEVCVDLMQKLSELPPVNQEPKTGHWIKSNIGGAKVCSVCNAHMGLSSFKFCPSCGAKMVEPQERSEKE